MSTKLENIQSLIYELSKEERARLREWFDEFEGDSWDSELDADVKDKKIESAAEQAKQNFTSGKFKDV
jgi:hypothetical protein